MLQIRMMGTRLMRIWFRSKEVQGKLYPRILCVQDDFQNYLLVNERKSYPMLLVPAWAAVFSWKARNDIRAQRAKSSEAGDQHIELPVSQRPGSSHRARHMGFADAPHDEFNFFAGNCG